MTASGNNPWPREVAAPARRALSGAGYRTLESLTEARERDLRDLHGIGPKALAALRLALRTRGLSFRSED
ncbi:DNA-binding protein [Actinomadura gamaensis]|uniref:DNA-binding protein n=1 Tax=Actinomadura gamaensis TaxID=1763541 RepID=A0ABV9TQK3_9ACTN